MIDVRDENGLYLGRWTEAVPDRWRPIQLHSCDLGPGPFQVFTVTFERRLFVLCQRSRCPNSILMEEREAIIIPSDTWRDAKLTSAVLSRVERGEGTDPFDWSKREWRRDLTRFDHGVTYTVEMSTTTAEETSE